MALEHFSLVSFNNTKVDQQALKCLACITVHFYFFNKGFTVLEIASQATLRPENRL